MKHNALKNNPALQSLEQKTNDILQQNNHAQRLIESGIPQLEQNPTFQKTAGVLKQKTTELGLGNLVDNAKTILPDITKNTPVTAILDNQTDVKEEEQEPIEDFSQGTGMKSLIW